MDFRLNGTGELKKHALQIAQLRGMERAGERASVAASNYLFGTNAAPIGAARTNSFSPGPFTSKFGKVLVVGFISSTFSAVDLEGTTSLLVGLVGAPPTGIVNAGHLTPVGAGLLSTILGAAQGIIAGTPFTPSIVLDSGAGNTVTTGANKAGMVLIDLPG